MWSSFIDRSFERYAIAVYLLTIIGIILFFRYNLCGFYALVLGLLFSPLYPFLWARAITFYGDYFGFPYLFAVISTVFYTLPFTLVSIIAFAVITLQTRIKNKRTV